MAVPDRAELPCGLAYLLIRVPGKLSDTIPSHKNMATIYPTAVPSGGSEPNSDLDATQPVFDVYEAYQRALADEQVSPNQC